MNISLAGATAFETPFRHARVPALLESADANAILAWLETEAPWRLRVEKFYEQYEFSLLSDRPPERLKDLVNEAFIAQLRDLIQCHLGLSTDLDLVEITAHKLTSGQTIRVHNDFIGNEESHRVLIQLNASWSVADGGILMLFGSGRAEDLRSVVMPTHGSGFAFEISPRSFHAVSTIHSGSRYTLVYTFRTIQP